MQTLETWLLPIGIVMLITWMFTSIAKRRKRNAADPGARAHLARLHQKQALRDDLEQVAVEIEAMARRVGTQLDNKAQRLELLIAEADAKLARLDALQETAPSVQTPTLEPVVAPDAPTPAPMPSLVSETPILPDTPRRPPRKTNSPAASVNSPTRA